MTTVRLYLYAGMALVLSSVARCIAIAVYYSAKAALWLQEGAQRRALALVTKGRQLQR